MQSFTLQAIASTRTIRGKTGLSIPAPAHYFIFSSTQNHRNRNKLSTITTMISSNLSTLLADNIESATEFVSMRQSKSLAPVNVVDIFFDPEATDKINHGSVGALMRNEKIENARSIASTIREQRQQEHQTIALTFSTSVMQNALLERLEEKLLANAIEFTELKRLVDAWKGGVPAALLLLEVWEPEKVLDCTDPNDLLQKFEALLFVKGNECHKVRKLVAEARNKQTTQSTPRNPEDTAASSAPFFIKEIRFSNAASFQK
jgi:hypothetical protein